MSHSRGGVTMQSRSVTCLAIVVGVSLLLAGPAIAQTTTPGSSLGTPGASTGPTHPQPSPTPPPPTVGSQPAPGRPTMGSGPSQPRPSLGRSTPAPTPGTTPGTTTPGTTPGPGATTPGTTSGVSSLPVPASGFASPDQVRSVQQALQGKGMDPGPVDGVAGVRTQQAVREFQRQQNLPETGRLDPQTLQRLAVPSQ